MRRKVTGQMEFWTQAKDGDPRVKAIFDRHYSRRRYRDGRNSKLFVGPGEKTVLISLDGKAIFIWRRFLSRDGQQGINCAVFRNEGSELSSVLILSAEQIAWDRWPGQRLYTYVDGSKVQSVNPGYCFKVAGWKRCGITKDRGLLILEKHPRPSDF